MGNFPTDQPLPESKALDSLLQQLNAIDIAQLEALKTSLKSSLENQQKEMFDESWNKSLPAYIVTIVETMHEKLVEITARLSSEEKAGAEEVVPKIIDLLEKKELKKGKAEELSTKADLIFKVASCYKDFSLGEAGISVTTFESSLKWIFDSLDEKDEDAAEFFVQAENIINEYLDREFNLLKEMLSKHKYHRIYLKLCNINFNDTDCTATYKIKSLREIIAIIDGDKDLKNEIECNSELKKLIGKCRLMDEYKKRIENKNGHILIRKRNLKFYFDETKGELVKYRDNALLAFIQWMVSKFYPNARCEGRKWVEDKAEKLFRDPRFFSRAPKWKAENVIKIKPTQTLSQSRKKGG